MGKRNKSSAYRTVKKFNYELYLYSDPLNYVIIAVVAALSEAFLANSWAYSSIFFIRVFLTFFGALLVGWLVAAVKRR